ncbi:hypothetical protein RB2083_2931 [Rhodobacteraceae bacterium HTCC2083]|nr:hypothetical protein RB2083_2931 [Rhodobacteraceae bacterium HTCC2083]
MRVTGLNRILCPFVPLQSVPQSADSFNRTALSNRAIRL